jgi:hypothetical protein
MKEPRNLFDRGFGGSQNRSGRRGEEKTLAHTGTRTFVVQPIARDNIAYTIPTPE